MTYYLTFKKTDNKEYAIRDIICDSNDNIRNIRIINLDRNYRLMDLFCRAYIFYNKSDTLRIKNYFINKAINNIRYGDIVLNSFNIMKWI